MEKPEIQVAKSNCSPHAFGKLQKIWAVLFFKCSADFDILLSQLPGGILLGILGGGVPPGYQILTLFQTNKSDFPHPLSDQTSKIHAHF